MTPVNNTVPDQLVSKIRKLLALGNFNDNGNQAELALAKAKQLAVEYEIDLASIQIFDEKPKLEPIIKGEGIESGCRFSVTQKFVNWILQAHFNVKVIMSGGRYGGRYINLIGKKTDVETANYVNKFLNDELMRRWHSYQKKNNLRAAVRNSYLYGLYQGLDAKLAEAKKNAEEGKFSTMNNGEQIRGNYQLMVVNEKKRLENAVGDFYPHLRKVSISVGRAYRQDIIGDGKRDGRNINITRGIGNTNSRSLQYAWFMKKKNYLVTVESTVVRVYSVKAECDVQAEELVLMGEYDEIVESDEYDSEVINTKEV